MDARRRRRGDAPGPVPEPRQRGGGQVAGGHAGAGRRPAPGARPTAEESSAAGRGKGYDCDDLRRRLKRRGIDLICPHRKNRTRPRLQDGRKLRRYKRRWKVERSFAWLGNFRRLVVRWEHRIEVYRAFFHVACLLITLRKF
ncbi:MAG: transposase [Isosphaeraceae bacterium]|nr:transposase [Isosphaeraceae bacterium]